MKCAINTILLLLTFIYNSAHGQTARPSGVGHSRGSKDSLNVIQSQRQLFITPAHNVLTTHFDMVYGPSRVIPGDKAALSFSGTLKGLYMLSGAIYVGMGIGYTVMKSTFRDQATSGNIEYQATLVHIPLGIGFSIGDDRAQIINSIDLLPSYYLEGPDVEKHRRFAIGLAPELGFHIRIGSRLHLGLMGKVQLFQPYDKEEHTDWPRYGFAGAGVIIRYD
jgi:hypothetical protein